MKLTNVKINPVYNSYDDDIIEDFYNKVFEYANHYDRASAYFDSKILALYAKGLEKIYENISVNENEKGLILEALNKADNKAGLIKKALRFYLANHKEE